MKILILKPSSLGDVVQAIPVLRLLRQHFRGAEVYWWIERASAPLLEGDPDLAGVSIFDRSRWASPWHYGEIWNCISTLRRCQFDLVIDLQALARSAAVAWLANGAFTIGLHDWRELASGFYDVSVPRPSPATHAVDWYLEVLRRIEVPVHGNFEWLPGRAEVAAEVAAKFELRDSRYIILQPGARWENKRWPAEHFRELTLLLHGRDPDLRFAILGGKGDRELAETIAAADPEVCWNLAGRTTLPQMVELIRGSCGMVTNDTGPMHVAAALGKPVIAVFGPTSPARTGPYGQTDQVLQRRDLPCVPCLRDVCTYHEPIACLRGIPPAVVADAVTQRLVRCGPE